MQMRYVFCPSSFPLYSTSTFLLETFPFPSLLVFHSLLFCFLSSISPLHRPTLTIDTSYNLTFLMYFPLLPQNWETTLSSFPRPFSSSLPLPPPLLTTHTYTLLSVGLWHPCTPFPPHTPWQKSQRPPDVCPFNFHFKKKELPPSLHHPSIHAWTSSHTHTHTSKTHAHLSASRLLFC